MLTPEDRHRLAVLVVQAALVVAFVLVGAATVGLAWRIFRAAAGV